MKIKSLSVSGFRNLTPQNISFNKRISFIHGKNGQGKTSLLEAIYLLSKQRSFREAKISEIVSWDENNCFVEALLENNDIEKKVRYEIKNKKRAVFINDEKITDAKQFFSEIPIVSFTPADLNLVRGAPKDRRRFLDRFLSSLDPFYLESLVIYTRALKQRNALLKSDSQKNVSFWDENLIKKGKYIADKRKEFIDKIKDLSITHYKQIIGDEKEEIDISYRSDFLKDADVLSESEIENIYKESLTKDIRFQKTNYGIQNDDFNLYINSGSGIKRAKNTASQGQARTFSLSLILASKEFLEAKKETPAIILLDDVESELDQNRQIALEKIIENSENQVFITSTENNSSLKLIEENVDFYKVVKGKIETSNKHL